MANPQKENSFTPIVNKLVGQFAKTYMSSRESQIVWAVIRKTYGYQKKNEKISYSQLELLTGINRRHIAPALKRLIERRILTRHSEGKSVSYGIQEDYKLWDKPLPKPVTVNNITETGNSLLPDPVTKSLPNPVNTKERKKYLNKGNYILYLHNELKELRGFGDIWTDWKLCCEEIKNRLTTAVLKRQTDKTTEIIIRQLGQVYTTIKNENPGLLFSKIWINKKYESWNISINQISYTNYYSVVDQFSYTSVTESVKSGVHQIGDKVRKKKTLNKTSNCFSLSIGIKELKGFGEKWNSSINHGMGFIKPLIPAINRQIDDLLYFSCHIYNIIPTIEKPVEFQNMALCGTGYGTPIMLLDDDKYQLKQIKNKGFANNEVNDNDEHRTGYQTVPEQLPNNNKNVYKEKEYSLNSNEYRHPYLFYKQNSIKWEYCRGSPVLTNKNGYGENCTVVNKIIHL